MKKKTLIGLLVLILAISIFALIRIVSQSQSENQQFEILQNQIYLADESQEAINTVSRIVVESETQKSPTMLSKYAELYKLNSDIVGWIKIENTNINYPVMQTVDDEEFYLNRDFTKEYSLSGTPFLSADSTLEDSCGQLIIYGHNMKNDTMFSDLLLYKSQDFWEENKIIDLDTLYMEQSYEIFAVFSVDVQVDNGHFPFYHYTDFDSVEEFECFIEEILSLAFYSTDSTPSYDDSLLTLITCDGYIGSGRFVVMAKLVSE
ncbi:MAG: class B sortase [Lachnospiraceae bacterium]